MGDQVNAKMAVERPAQAIAVPGRSANTGADTAPPAAWALTDSFELALNKADIAKQSPLVLTQAFLGGLSANRVALHRALDDGFSTAITLADPDAWKAVLAKINQHFADVSGVCTELAAELKRRGLGPLASIVTRANALEDERVKTSLELSAARQRMASAQYAADAALTSQVQGLQGRLSSLTTELNEAFSELRCEAEDLE
jgi:cytochrome c551/c552